jgi:hypothetical protein
MIGTAIFVLAAVFEHSRDKNLTSFAFIFLAATIFCWGAYAAWSDTDKRLQQEISKHQGSRLEGSVKRGYLDMRSLEGRGSSVMASGCCVTLLVEITNHNYTPARLKPSDTKLKMLIEGKSYNGELEHIPAGVLLVDDDTVRVKAITDFFDGMYYSTAIQQGEPRVGHMRFIVEEFNQEIAKGRTQLDTKATVIIVDTLSKSHTISESVPLMVAKMLSAKDAITAVLDVADLIRNQPES